MTIRIAIIGFGKIAREQHLPAIRADPRFELVGVTSRSGDPGVGVPATADLAGLIVRLGSGLDAVALCTPADVRPALADQALQAGLAVLLEKPPAATLGAVEALATAARRAGRTVFASWHARHAPAVAAAAQLLEHAAIARLRIDWREDVRVWHPGQDWVWQPGGFGVFDPGINALSIACALVPQPLVVTAAQLDIPANRQAPIRAALTFAGPDHSAVFDWSHQGAEHWTIAIDTADGRQIRLEQGGARLLCDGAALPVTDDGEYPSLYAHFARLIAAGESDIDTEPLRIVADAGLVAQRSAVAPFAWNGSC